jgi:hypothetical protein
MTAPHDQIPGPGHVNGWRENLAAVAEDAGTVPAGSPTIAEANAGHNALEKCIRLLWNAGDNVTKQLVAGEGLLRGATQNAQAAAVASLFPSGGQVTVDAVNAATARNVRNEATALFASQVVSGIAKDAEQAGAEASQAMADLGRAVEAAKLGWYGPRGLSATGDFSIERAHRVVAIGGEIEGKHPQEWHDMYEQLISLGDEAQTDLFEQAARPLVNRVIAMSDADANKRFKDVGNLPRVNKPMTPREAANKLRSRMIEHRRETEPAYIAVGERCLLMLAAIYKEVLGVDPALMSTRDFKARFLQNGNAREAPNPWGVDPGWVSRRLGPYTDANRRQPPPGWSPIVTRTKLGAVVRAAKE